MKISFWISAIVFYVVNVAFSNSVQVGTVLFTTTDLVKRCWTDRDKSLLKARLIMQDVLPDPDCIDFSKPEAGVILLDYFHACYQIIATSTYGKIQNLMFLALSDTIGGYLRAYVLPFTRRAYYAGQIKYSEAKKLFQLYDDIRIFLKTNGFGWAGPPDVCYNKIRVKPLTITGGSLEACNQLYTIETEAKLHCINPPKKSPPQPNVAENHSSSSTKEGRPDAQRTYPNASTPTPHHDCNPHASTPTPSHNPQPLRDPTDTGCTFYDDFLSQDSNNGTQRLPDDSVANRKCRSDSVCRKSNPLNAKRVIIPLPVLDDCCAPQSIAVPFRKRPLRNLCARNSAFILEYYYVAVIKCFIAKGNTRTDIKNFNSQFHAWLMSQVFPHLKDEKWYPAFGGVLRVMETIRKFGAETTVKDPALHDIAYMFDKGVQFDVMDAQVSGIEKVRNVKEVDDCCTIPKRRYLIAILVVSLIAIFIFCTCAFYCQATRGSYLLYEGHSEASSYSRVRRPAYKKKDKFINFQFLVKFFTKKQNLPIAEEVQYFATIEKQTDVWKSLPQAVIPRSPEDTHQCKEQAKKDLLLGGEVQEGKSKEKGRLTIVGEGSVPSYMVCRAGETHPPWDRRTSTRRDETEGEEGESDVEGEHDEVHMLWRKPSVRFKRNVTLRDDERTAKGKFERTPRSSPTTTTGTTSDDFFSKTSSNSCSASMDDESKGSSTEKLSSTPCCSESCQHSSTTSISSYSRTQVEEKLSSATMQFFEKVIARHKLHRKSPPQESTAESDSEVDVSYSSESNY